MGRIAVASITILWLIPVSILVNHIVPDPYMDEIFHVPRCQQYCRGNFRSWDPMITTPPGLYFLSLAYIASLFPGLYCMQAVLSFSDSCSTSVLRLTNGVLAVICSILIYDIIIHVRPSLDDKKATIFTVVLSLYPLHWFFTFLYYTDVASLASVLSMYLLTLKRKYLFSSLLGALSVLIRQTNILWVFFVAGTGFIEFIQSHQKECMEVDVLNTSKKDDDMSPNLKGVSVASNLRKRKVNSGAKNQNEFTLRTYDPMAYSSGAKDAHAVSLHFAQLLYFGVVIALFTFPVHFSLSRAAILFQQFCKNKVLNFLQWSITLAIGLLIVQFFSIAHPYLLADNRHYTFYMWRRVINYQKSTKYLMVPLYIYSWFSIVNNLAKNQKKLWIFAYAVACVASLVPASLIEFRYYTIPFFFLVLHTNITYKILLSIGLLYLSINCFTMFMFLYRPFSWKQEAGTQRFIW